MAEPGDHDPLMEALAQYRKPQPELRAGDPAVFREPTLINMLLGRYAPSGLLANYYNPETREGAASARRWGGLMDDVLLSLLGIRSPRGADTATGAMLHKRAEKLGDYGPDIGSSILTKVQAEELGGMRSASMPDPELRFLDAWGRSRTPAQPAGRANNDPWGDRAGYDALVARLRAENEAASAPPTFRIIPGGKAD